MTDLVPDSRSVNLAVWPLLWGALVAWHLVTRHVPSLPSFGSVVAAVRRRWAGRWTLLLGWAWLGWHLFVRTTY